MREAPPEILFDILARLGDRVESITITHRLGDAEEVKTLILSRSPDLPRPATINEVGAGESFSINERAETADRASDAIFSAEAAGRVQRFARELAASAPYTAEEILAVAHLAEAIREDGGSRVSDVVRETFGRPPH